MQAATQYKTAAAISETINVCVGPPGLPDL